MDALRALLEEIGWSAPPDDPRVDLRTHGRALIEALEDPVNVHADMLRDIAEDDERRVAMARNMAALTSLALTVLLKVQAQILREGCCSTFADELATKDRRPTNWPLCGRS